MDRHLIVFDGDAKPIDSERTPPYRRFPQVEHHRQTMPNILSGTSVNAVEHCRKL
jgi:hypothetical protein